MVGLLDNFLGRSFGPKTGLLNSILNQNPQVYGPQEMQGPPTVDQYYGNMPMQDTGGEFLSEYEMPLEQPPLQAQTIQQAPLQTQQAQPQTQAAPSVLGRLLNGSDGKGGFLGYASITGQLFRFGKCLHQ